MSIATVSRVLNNADHVAPHTRELVQRAVDRLSDQALGPRTAPARATQGPVYLRCPYLLTDYFGLIVSSIAETLELHDRPVLLNAGEAAQQAAVLPGLPSRPGISGAILVLPPEPGEQLVDLRARGLPFVVVDPRAPMPRDIAAVSAAHYAGSRSISTHLADLGHRRIGVIAGPHNWLASDARLAGHASALANAGVLPDPRLVRSGEPTAQFGYHAAGELLDLPRAPPRSSGSTTRSPSARWPRPRSADCGYPRTCRSPASTTSTSPRPPGPCSQPSVSRCRKWAASPSASSSASLSASASTPCTSNWPPNWSSATPPAQPRPANKPTAKSTPQTHHPERTLPSASPASEPHQQEY